jgi:hypothetical protein
MSDIQDSWSLPGAAPLTAAAPATACACLQSRGWFVAWVCSAAACLAGAALTRYPQPASFTAGVSCDVSRTQSLEDGPSPPGATPHMLER